MSEEKLGKLEEKLSKYEFVNSLLIVAIIGFVAGLVDNYEYQRKFSPSPKIAIPIERRTDNQELLQVTVNDGKKYLLYKKPDGNFYSVTDLASSDSIINK